MILFKRLELAARGKTKEVWLTDQRGFALFVSTDNLTSGDGAKHNTIPGKGVLANLTTCNVFRFLSSCEIPTSYVKQIDDTSFFGQLCDMIPYEVVVRREAYGSYLKAYPKLVKGHLFQQPVVQFFLKTSGKTWEGMEIPVDDPLAIFDKDGQMHLYRPDQEIANQEPFSVLGNYPLKHSPKTLSKIKEIALETFLALEKAWQQVNGDWRLIDLKIEFGVNRYGLLLLADVIDSDSWRVLSRDGEHLDKQSYRDGAGLDVVLEKYKIAAKLTETFKAPLL